MLAQLRFLLRVCSVYRRFVEDFSKIAQPLTDRTRNDASPYFTNLTMSENKAFDIHKQRLASPLVLSVPEPGGTYTLDYDASAYQLGCALLQKKLDETLLSVGYWFYSLNDTERIHHTLERKRYAVVWTTTSLHPYIERVRFTDRTHHDALQCLVSLSEISGRLARWRLRLAELSFTIEYRRERVHVVPDACSRSVPSGAPPRTVHDEIPSFHDSLLLLRPHSKSKQVSTPLPTVDGSVDDGVVLIRSVAQ